MLNKLKKLLLIRSRAMSTESRHSLFFFLDKHKFSFRLWYFVIKRNTFDRDWRHQVSWQARSNGEYSGNVLPARNLGNWRSNRKISISPLQFWLNSSYMEFALVPIKIAKLIELAFLNGIHENYICVSTCLCRFICVAVIRICMLIVKLLFSTQTKILT